MSRPRRFLSYLGDVLWGIVELAWEAPGYVASLPFSW